MTSVTRCTVKFISWPIFKVQRDYDRLASGSEDVNPENFGHRHGAVVFFEISPSEKHPNHSSRCKSDSRRISIAVVLGPLNPSAGHCYKLNIS
jgi:hypothetical protein